jgi:hypothetical protein
MVLVQISRMTSLEGEMIPEVSLVKLQKTPITRTKMVEK